MSDISRNKMGKLLGLALTQQRHRLAQALMQPLDDFWDVRGLGQEARGWVDRCRAEPPIRRGPGCDGGRWRRGSGHLAHRVVPRIVPRSVNNPMARPDGQRIGHGRLDFDSGYQIFGVWRSARFISSSPYITPASGNMLDGTAPPRELDRDGMLAGRCILSIRRARGSPSVHQRKETTMSPLRERMIEDMILAGLALGTRQAYTQAVRRLAARYRRSPDQLSEEEVRSYLLELRQQGVARGTFKIGLYGLRFLYQHTLRRDWDLFREKKDRRTGTEAAASRAVGGSGPSTARPRPQHDPPDVPRHHVCVRPAHQRGHHLEIGSVDRANQVLRIIGKGDKERLVPLPQPVLDELGRLWRTHHNRRWLFPNRHGDAPLNQRVLSETFAAAAATAITFQLARAGAAPDSMLWAADRCHTDTAEIVTGLLAVPRINAR